MKCGGKTREGSDCKRPAIKGQDYCQAHYENSSYRQYLRLRKLKKSQAKLAADLYHRAKLQY